MTDADNMAKDCFADFVLSVLLKDDEGAANCAAWYNSETRPGVARTADCCKVTKLNPTDGSYMIYGNSRWIKVGPEEIQAAIRRVRFQPDYNGR